MEELWYRFLDWRFRSRAGLLSLKCFVVGHDIKVTYGWDAGDWCDRCYKSSDHHKTKDVDDLLTIPVILNILYTWLCDKNWGWAWEVDLWIQDRLGQRLPKWWEY